MIVKETEKKVVNIVVDIIIKKFESPDNSLKNNEFFNCSNNIFKWKEQIILLMGLYSKEAVSEKVLNDITVEVIASAKHKVVRGADKDKTIKLNNSTWLNSSRENKIGWGDEPIKTYRDRYFKYLEDYKNRSKEQLTKSKLSSLRVIQNIGDPLGSEAFNSRGLVIGPVQGGKTEHFNGVVATAFDSGYHLVIVMSGIMEDLRRQTQERIQEELLGTSEGGLKTGAEMVSSFGPQPEQEDVNPINVLTSSTNDFNATAADGKEGLSASKTLIICKKNGAILKQVLIYLQKQAGNGNEQIPILIIDDEADNASLNNNSYKDKTVASLINKRIRAILKLFSKSAYVGYTASPFANILQNRERDYQIDVDAFKYKDEEYKFEVCDGLFPTHLIELIEPPPTYIGLKLLFDTNAELTKLSPIFGARIDDDLQVFPRRLDKETNQPTTLQGKGTRAANKDDPYPEKLPHSLKDAVYCFILAVAIRKTRSRNLRNTPYHQPHNTMLIHISRFINWQTRTKEKMSEFLSEISYRLANEPKNHRGGIYEILEKQFDRSFASSLTMGIDDYLPENYLDEYMSVVSFNDIKSLLDKTVDEIECVALNSQTKDSLRYNKKNPKTYIAIGGNRLSRGFTLEGLSTCYFIRETNFADTLLQMGRWFGYRIGYLDCCKLFFTEDAIDKFDSISRTVEDLESTIEDLSKDPKSKPSDYALKVASNPGVIKLTRTSMLKHTKTKRVSFEDHLEQTYKFLVDDNSIDAAYSAVSKLISEKSNHFKLEKNTNMIVYRGADPTYLKKLLECPRSFSETNIKDILNFIQACNKQNKLTDWTIAIKTSGTGGKVKSEDFGFKNIEMQSTLRQISKGAESRSDAIKDLLLDDPIFRVGGRNANILDPIDMKVAIEDSDMIKKAEKEWLKDNPSKKNVPAKVYRNLQPPQKGVIIIYLIDSAGIYIDKKTGKVMDELRTKRQLFKTDKPFIGFVIGIPKISDSPLVVYVEDENISIYQNELDGNGNEDPTIVEEIWGD